ncbi:MULTISPECIES: LLM class flavin-dependent oxidoreductase [Actinoalloteichus]|uniref:Alkanal monooxygenase (Luciferase) n=1 Tax=Actinoalloteichus fjordicus TaxID=1612552 RepID=A0AAC9PU12_9PSEU|nr:MULTISPECIES: LLM class flavin-dependent oxidoreductase [Actinoalloteichus]APU16461.1 alkanal monooxygenase (luciferase) [Actinoalloteichus fjordicus]APU22520.1 alkanal monooxygenase (luciferase) [Actinoalloteichus sp. GBA129-24]
MLFTHRFPGQDDGEVLHLALELADLAEQVEFDALWTTEHHFISYGVNPSALTLAGHLLGRTRRLRVGTAVTILPSHPPVYVAEQTALLDQLSGGRFDLGIGRGGPVVDYAVLGRSMDDWRDGLPEALSLLLDSFTGTVASDSELYRFPEVRPGPTPLTRPHPPVYVAATSPPYADLAALRRLPMLFFFHQDVAAQAALVSRHAERCGLPATSFTHGAAMIAQITDSAAEADTLIHGTTVPFFTHAQSEYVMLEERPGGQPPPKALAELFLQTQAIGPVEQCVDRVVAVLSTPGLRRVLLHAESSGDHDAILHNVRRLGTEVLPEVRRRLAAGAG